MAIDSAIVLVLFLQPFFLGESRNHTAAGQRTPKMLYKVNTSEWMGVEVHVEEPAQASSPSYSGHHYYVGDQNM